jgi:hypothetical protein
MDLKVFDYIKFPAYMKPYAGGWMDVYRLENKEEFWEKHQETGQLVMMLQEEIVLLNISECIVLAVKRLELCNTNREMNSPTTLLMDLQ